MLHDKSPTVPPSKQTAVPSVIPPTLPSNLSMIFTWSIDSPTDVYLPAGDCRNPFAVAHRQSERALPAQKLWTHHSVEYRDRQVGLSYNARDCFVCNVYASLPGKRLCDCSNSSNPSAVVATSPASRPANASNSSQVSNRRNHPNTLSRARQTPTSPASKQSAHPSTAALGSVRYRADSASRCPQTCNTGTACPATQEKAHRTLA
jgi:hypothetical protein